MIGGTLPMKEKARMVMTKIVNMISVKMEMGAPMISMYLLGNPDHYTDYKFIPFFWQSFVTEAERAFDKAIDPLKVTLIKQKRRIVGGSAVFDYIYRPTELEDMSLYDWVHQFSHVKLQKQTKSTQDQNKDIDAEHSLQPDIYFSSISSQLSDSSSLEYMSLAPVFGRNFL